jgi:hypothetical protein
VHAEARQAHLLISKERVGSTRRILLDTALNPRARTAAFERILMCLWRRMSLARDRASSWQGHPLPDNTNMQRMTRGAVCRGMYRGAAHLLRTKQRDTTPRNVARCALLI